MVVVVVILIMCRRLEHLNCLFYATDNDSLLPLLVDVGCLLLVVCHCLLFVFCGLFAFAIKRTRRARGSFGGCFNIACYIDQG